MTGNSITPILPLPNLTKLHLGLASAAAAAYQRQPQGLRRAHHRRHRRQDHGVLPRKRNLLPDRRVHLVWTL